MTVTLFRLLTPRAGMAREEFLAHWESTHAPLVASCEEWTRHIQRYVRYPRSAADVRARPEVAAQGFASVTFADVAALRAARREPALGALLADEDEFLDRAASPAVLCGPAHVLIARPTNPVAAVRLMALLARARGSSAHHFRSYWLHVHAPLFLAQATLTRPVERYEQHHRLDDETVPYAGFDGMAVEWFRGTDAYDEYWRDPAYTQVVSPDEPAFVDKPRNVRLLVDEPVVEFTSEPAGPFDVPQTEPSSARTGDAT